MKLLVPLLCICSLILASCAGTPKGDYTQANETFILVVSQLNAARSAGKISDADWNRPNDGILANINRGNETMRTMSQLAQTNTTSTTDYKAVLKGIVDSLIKYQTEHPGTGGS